MDLSQLASEGASYYCHITESQNESLHPMFSCCQNFCYENAELLGGKSLFQLTPPVYTPVEAACG